MKLYKLSLWAKENKVKARILIVLFQIIKGVCGVFAGIILGDIVGKPGGNYFIIPVIAGLIALFLYPAVGGRKTWKKRKISDAILVFCGLAIWVGIGMQSEGLLTKPGIEFPGQFLSNNLFGSQAPQVHSGRAMKVIIRPHRYGTIIKSESNLVIDNETSKIQSAGEQQETSLDKSKIRTSQKNIVSDAKASQHNSAKASKGGKIVLFILSILVAIGLGALVLFFASGLACGGSEIIALIVLVFGWGGLLTGLILLARHLFRKRNNQG